MKRFSRYPATTAAALVAAAASLVLAAPVCLAQDITAAPYAYGYPGGTGVYSQGAGSQSAVAGGDMTGDSSAAISVPLPGGGQVTAAEPQPQTPGAGSTLRGGIWSLDQNNPISLGGTPQTGP